MCRKHHEIVRQAAQPHLERGQLLQREMDGQVRAEKVRPRDGAQHHGSPREQGARPARLGEQVALVVRRVARCMNGADCHIAERKLATGPHLVDVGSRLGGKLAPPRHEVVVQVRVEGVGQLDVERGGAMEVAIDVAQRVDHQADTPLGVGD